MAPSPRHDHVQSWWDRPLLVAVALISSHGTGWGLVESPTSPKRLKVLFTSLGSFLL